MSKFEFCDKAHKHVQLAPYRPVTTVEAHTTFFSSLVPLNILAHLLKHSLPAVACRLGTNLNQAFRIEQDPFSPVLFIKSF